MKSNRFFRRVIARLPVTGSLRRVGAASRRDGALIGRSRGIKPLLQASHGTALRLLLSLSLSLSLSLRAADPLAAGFAQPPAQTKPWCYWYWINDNISREGITRDLEAMARVGIGEVLIGNIFLDNQPAGKVKLFTDEWWALVAHAMREGGRVGVNIGMFNCPGWSQSGGPWIKPASAMRYIVSSETRVQGPRRFAEKLPAPKEDFQDVAVLAFPAPALDADGLAGRSPQVVCTPAVAGAEKLVDGDETTVVAFPAGAGRGAKPFTVEIQLPAPLTARTLQIVPGEEAFGAECELLAGQPDGSFRSLRTFKCDRSNMDTKVGPMPRGPVTISFPAVTAARFRLVFTGYFARSKVPALAEVRLSGAARLESFVEKQLGKMHPTPLPMWDAYLWPAQAEPDHPGLVVPADGVRNLTAQLAPDGTLRWEVPPGDWIILRSGMAPTGVRNHPASPEGKGLEGDKMNRAVAQAHFDAFIGEVLRRVPVADRKAFTRVVADSYETGSENWTDGFDQRFRAAYGYDPKPWLPVLTGRLIGGAGPSERFLWDLRRFVADQIATQYVGTLRQAAAARGLGLWLENYGHWGFPGEFLKYGAESDRIGGEYWVTGDLGSIECRAASSCANTYGKPLVSAESFTGGPPFQNAPAALKARGDWAFCEGVNHFVLHVAIQQPWEDRVPGVNAPWGTEFNRHNTWYERSTAWIDYVRRSCWLLQQGHRVVDVAYFIGEDAPKMTGVRSPALPRGYDFDYINAEVIKQTLTVRAGLLTLPHGPAYRVLVLPGQKTMRPALLRQVRDLVRAGATVLGPAPTQSPSLQGYPQGDREVQQLAAELWGGPDLPSAGERMVGRGRVVWGRTLEEVLAATATPADLEFRPEAADATLLFTHRRSAGAEIYFLSNQRDRAERVTAAFRIAGRQPELWDAVSGERRDLANWRTEGDRTLVPLEFAPRQSWFVVFRRPASAPRTPGVNFAPSTTLATLGGDWEVSFDPQWGGPAQVTFASLADWSRHADPGIRYYSGRAVYRKTFDYPPALAVGADAGRLLLDLGAVRDLAVVRLNGRELGTRWIAPWEFEVSNALRPGGNDLEVEIINPWNNRLVGDAALPATERRTSLTLATVKATAPLLPAGLLGPVTLRRSGLPLEIRAK